MKKRFLFVLDAAVILVVVCFFLSICYRMAFPMWRYDRQISFVQLFMILPVATGGLWLLFRMLRKDRSNTCFYKFCRWMADGEPNRRLLVTAVGAVTFICIMEFISFVMKVAL
ncbi:hypothetical protein [Trinickia fusca]|uniref:Uncharacterized protein n=1 Tax=Trinickia fusca TaxID=2419777 RepID=A0A494WZF4_9BURK|nr:hypothetical protein [Trinickia fusca]RKP43847.1 hypothetical protein D7S89_24505 [Trinickia fusca]